MSTSAKGYRYVMADQQPRTVLEQRIWEHRQTLDEFTEYAERFAREHHERGTLSRRHLDRLVSGRGTGGKPLGRPNPATARLLEHIFGASVDELLSPPAKHDDRDQELQDRIQTARRVDHGVLDLLHDQLTRTRRLDRQLGAVVAHGEVLAKMDQVDQLRRHSLTPDTRERLAELLAELGTLAGWQALDMGNLNEAWKHYETAKTAASETERLAFIAHTAAEQAFVLLDLGETSAAAELLGALRTRHKRRIEPLLQSWLAAAHGEALAAQGNRSNSLRAFDAAAALLPTDTTQVDGPYVALDPVHLARWRGHALARIGEPEAVQVLTTALAELDPTFTRAATALHVDLATALTAERQPERARAHLKLAMSAANGIGSHRQHKRITSLETYGPQRHKPRPSRFPLPVNAT